MLLSQIDQLGKEIVFIRVEIVLRFRPRRKLPPESSFLSRVPDSVRRSGRALRTASRASNTHRKSDDCDSPKDPCHAMTAATSDYTVPYPNPSCCRQSGAFQAPVDHFAGALDTGSDEFLPSQCPVSRDAFPRSPGGHLRDDADLRRCIGARTAGPGES